MNTRRFNRSGQEQRFKSAKSIADRSALPEEDFLRVIGHERKRAERTHKPCLLMLVEMRAQFSAGSNSKALATILNALSTATRETDVTGWYRDEAEIGVLFTEVMADDGAAIVTRVMARVSEALRTRLTAWQFNQASVSFHLFPADAEEDIPAVANPALYPSLASMSGGERLVER